MIKLSNGHPFEYMTASGALGFDGKCYLWEKPLQWLGLIDPALFTVVTKTVTYEPRKGNLQLYDPRTWKCIYPFGNGVLNAAGLPNLGIEWFCKKIGPDLDSSKVPIVVSIFSDEVEELIKMTGMLNEFKIVGIEINRSCPNVAGECLHDADQTIEICKALKQESHLPLILKLSVAHPIKEIVPHINGLVEAISINSVPWSTFSPDKKSPLVNFGGGGVSGKIVQPYTWNLVKELVKITSIPIIGPSVWKFDDIKRLRELGAEAISFGSIHLLHPWRPTMFARKDMKLKKQRTL